jgi:hypothetical protein
MVANTMGSIKRAIMLPLNQRKAIFVMIQAAVYAPKVKRDA